MRDDPFDADVGGVEQRGNKLFGQVLGEISEEIGGDQENASIAGWACCSTVYM